jgi:hypothetical protein
MLTTFATTFAKYLLLILCSDIITYVSDRQKECCANETLATVTK